MCYLFVNVFKWDIPGVSIATMITYTTLIIIITVYGSLSKELKECWIFPNKDTFKDTYNYLKIAIPSCLMICAEWWQLEVLLILCGYLGVDLAAT